MEEDQNEYLDNLTQMLETEIEQNKQLLDAIIPKLRCSITEMTTLLKEIEGNCWLTVEDQKVDAETLMLHNEFTYHKHFVHDLHFIKLMTGKSKSNLPLKAMQWKKYFRE